MTAPVREIQRKNCHERFHVDSKGRRWDFVQREKLHYHWGHALPPGHEWNCGKLVWVCGECKGEESVEWTSLTHDEVTVPDPDAQLSAHACKVGDGAD